MHLSDFGVKISILVTKSFPKCLEPDNDQNKWESLKDIEKRNCGRIKIKLLSEFVVKTGLESYVPCVQGKAWLGSWLGEGK